MTWRRQGSKRPDTSLSACMARRRQLLSKPPAAVDWIERVLAGGMDNVSKR